MTDGVTTLPVFCECYCVCDIDAYKRLSQVSTKNHEWNIHPTIGPIVYYRGMFIDSVTKDFVF
jgi:hypothetical protein